jgi:hypothetical protein
MLIVIEREERETFTACNNRGGVGTGERGGREGRDEMEVLQG